MSGRSLSPVIGLLLQVVFGTLPLLILLCWFLWVANYFVLRPPCVPYLVTTSAAAAVVDDDYAYDDDEYNFSNMNGGSRSSTSRMVICPELQLLYVMVAVFMIVATVWCHLVVYLQLYVPRRHALLQLYLDEGDIQLGDVVYEPRHTCFGGGSTCCSDGNGSFLRCCCCCCFGYPCNPSESHHRHHHENNDDDDDHYHHQHPQQQQQHHVGTVTYQHVNFQVYPAYVSRRVPIMIPQTREQVSIFVLPNYPFSGMPARDVELGLAAAARSRKKLRMLKVVAYIWFAFCVCAPVYLLVCMDTLNVPIVGQDTLWNWILYAVGVLVIIPLVSLVVNHKMWMQYVLVITQTGSIAQHSSHDGDSSSASSETLGTLLTTPTQAVNKIEGPAGFMGFMLYQPPPTANSNATKSTPPSPPTTTMPAQLPMPSSRSRGGTLSNNNNSNRNARKKSFSPTHKTHRLRVPPVI